MTVQIVVELTPEGGIRVTGPVENTLLCLGLLEAAKAVVLRRDAPRVVPVTGPVPVPRAPL